MKHKYLFILFLLLATCYSSSAQIGTSSLGVITLASPSPGKGNTIGGSNLPVCTPQNFACNTNASLTYIFTGTGNWTAAENWVNNLVPPQTLTNGFKIIISPLGEGECILNVPQKILPGAMFTIQPNKKLRVDGGVIIQ